MIQPTKQDKFSFGLWTIGWQARDTFGDATRPPLDPVVSVSHLGELGAWGVTFHDDDLIPFGSDENERERLIKRFRKAAAGESAAQLRSDVSAYENYDVELAATKGYDMVHLDQLAIEHILGAR
jgi:hypothetical protein